MARVLHHNFSLAHTFVGTPYYMSPVSTCMCMWMRVRMLILQELLREQSYDEKSDLWALGCLLFELCSLEPPFTASNRKMLETKIKLGNFKRIPSLYSTALYDSIAMLLQSNVCNVCSMTPLPCCSNQMCVMCGVLYDSIVMLFQSNVCDVWCTL